MEDIGLTEGINITITAIVVVFLVLIGLQIVLIAFNYLFKKDGLIEDKQMTAEIERKKEEFEEDEETKQVAFLMALILANDNQQDKHYKVTSIKRIK
ncbi:MAG: OadG family protein [Pisciglobus halotolerans]|nr:OadG family protein [Pisciglobus halotolerans]